MKKLSSLLVLFFMMQASFADEIKNEPVSSAEVVLAAYNDENILVPLGEPVKVEADGSFNINLPEGFPEHIAVFAIAQDPNGEGIPQVSALTGDVTTIDAANTAIANTLQTFLSSTDGIDPVSVDISQVKQFVEKMGEALEGVPSADTAAATVDRMAQALSLKPDALLQAVDGNFNVKPEDTLKVASLIDKAAAPEGFNPLGGTQPPPLPSDFPPGISTAGLLSPELVSKMSTKGFDFNKTFGDTVVPPGGLQYLDASGKQVPIPAGSYTMPPVTANPNVKFPVNAFIPAGATVPAGFNLPPNATLSPGVSVGPGVEFPKGFQIPPGVALPEGFDVAKSGVVQLDSFVPQPNFVMPPGFAMLNQAGGVGVPQGMAYPSGVKVPGNVMQMPPQPGFDASKLPPPPKGSEAISSFQVPPLSADAFDANTVLPSGFNPQNYGMQQPPGYQGKVPPPPVDMGQFKGDNFVPFDPFGGTFKPGQTVPPSMGNIDPTAAFMPAPNVGPNNPGNSGGGQGPATGGNNPGQGSANPEGGGNKGPNNPGYSGGGQGPATGGANQPATGGSNPSSGSGSAPTGPAPAPSAPAPTGPAPAPSAPAPTGAAPAPSAPPPSAPPPPPPSAPSAPPPQSRKFSVTSTAANNAKTISVLASEAESVKVGSRLDLTVSTKAKARKVTASQGVYSIGKAKAGASSTKLALIVDPSVSASTVKVTIAATDNSVEVTDLSLDKENVTQLITQLGSKIEMTTAGTDIEDLGISSVTGYILAPGTSAVTLKSAIPVKGVVQEGTSGQIVSFTKPKKPLADGVYTIVFQDGDETYYGKFTVGTPKTRKITGTVLAPGGKL